MNIPEIAVTGLLEIRHHKLRSTLTLIGIILGTFAIIFMTSMLNGVILSVWKGIEELGFDGVMYVVQRQPKDGVERARFALSEGLAPRDAEILLERRDLIADVAPVQQGEQLIAYGSVRREIQIQGVTPAYARVRSRHTSQGRFFNDHDMRTFNRVSILGHRLSRRLFGAESPLGREVQMSGLRFKVIGVGPQLGNRFVNDGGFLREMEGALVPLTTLRKYITGDETPLSFIAIKTTRMDALELVQAEVQASLSVAHHGVGDFRVENIAQDMVRERDEVEEIVFNWQVVLGTIAGISLLVGGLGLLSVMLISINERLYEIGMRKAIGANDLEIFLMFLIESVTLALTGAAIGVGVALVLILYLERFFPWGLPIDWIGVGWAIGVAVLLGLVFGIVPALRASRLSPVEAMRGA